MTTIIFSLLLIFSTVYQCFIWLVVYPKANKISSSQVKFPISYPVSIVICTKDRLDLVAEHLPLVLNQQYSDFQIIIVSDGLKNYIPESIEKLLLKDSKLSIIKYNKKSSGKKEALICGIQAAKYEWILLTDDDCRPASQFWIQNMMNCIKTIETKIVLGFAPYEFQSGLLNQFIRFESVLNTLQYFSAAQWGYPYMGVGRNLLYHKSIFDEQLMHLEHLSGDDDLLINAKATKTNTTVCLDEKSFVFTDAKTSWPEYFNQRIRHYSSAKFYRFQTKIYLFSLSFSLIIFYLSLLMLIFHSQYKISITCLVIHFITCSFIFSRLNKNFNSSDLKWKFPIFEILYVFFIFIQSPLLLFKNRNW
ncbi:MAG: glycosyltransferase [Saprospiraceae bacterium]